MGTSYVFLEELAVKVAQEHAEFEGSQTASETEAVDFGCIG
jgi:hypothetical protein